MFSSPVFTIVFLILYSLWHAPKNKVVHEDTPVETFEHGLWTLLKGPGRVMVEDEPFKLGVYPEPGIPLKRLPTTPHQHRCFNLPRSPPRATAATTPHTETLVLEKRRHHGSPTLTISEEFAILKPSNSSPALHPKFWGKRSLSEMRGRRRRFAIKQKAKVKAKVVDRAVVQ